MRGCNAQSRFDEDASILHFESSNVSTTALWENDILDEKSSSISGNELREHFEIFEVQIKYFLRPIFVFLNQTLFLQKQPTLNLKKKRIWH